MANVFAFAARKAHIAAVTSSGPLVGPALRAFPMVEPQRWLARRACARRLFRCAIPRDGNAQPGDIGMSIGTVKWFNATKGYGFIQPEDGSKDVFVHISDVQRAGLNGLNEGDKVEYEMQRGQQGKVSAGNLRLA
jgi:CspA family cold shock protein